MPHLTLQYTANLSASLASKNLLLQCHQILATTGGIKMNNCKSRAIAFDAYLIGAGETESSFVHLDVAFLEGRSWELKRKIGEQLLQVLLDVYTSVDPSIQITVEVRDIQRKSYFKYPAGTLG